MISRGEIPPALDREKSSFDRAIKKFDNEAAVSKYPADYKPTFRHQRERRTVEKLLQRFPAGGHILDLPSGTGRIARPLLEAGFRVTCADYSSLMVGQCRENMLAINPEWADRSEYLTRDINDSGFPDRSFDGVICNRLFHHYGDSETRIRALRELVRVSRGPVIVSFACSFALSVHYKRLKNIVRRRGPGDYRPIPASQMKSEFHEAGLTACVGVPVHRGFARMWYMVGTPAKDMVRTA
jgi:ubiquinone/menaquinone biosynthesis C-methylase UbiE